MADACIAKALRSGARQRTGETLVRQQLVTLELVEHPPYFLCIRIRPMTRELARKLLAAMLTAREQSNRAAQQAL